MPDHKQHNRQQAQRANDATLHRDNELLGGDAERARRAANQQRQGGAPAAADEEEE